MIIGTADQNTGFLHADLFHQLEVLLARANPAGNFGKFISFFQTFVHCIPIFFTVKEKLTLTDLSFRSAKFMEVIVNRHDLLCRIWCSRLLTVTERRIGNPDVLWHIVRNGTVIEWNLRNFRIREHIPENIRLLHVIQNVHMLFDLEQVLVLIHGDRTVSKCIVHDSFSFVCSPLSSKQCVL